MSEAIIERFAGENAFLSNFFESPVLFRGRLYLNAEAAFQSQKCPRRAGEFQDISAKQAKYLGRQVEIRPDWDKVKYMVMYEVVSEKFSQNEELRKKLLSTGDAVLVEGNTWGDRYWGVCNGTGENHLGKILMKVRREQSIDKLQNVYLDVAYQHGLTIASNAKKFSEDFNYDIPVIHFIWITGESVMKGISDYFADAGIERFVWVPNYAMQSLESFYRFNKTLGWKMTDIVHVPVGKYQDNYLFDCGYLFEKVRSL